MCKASWSPPLLSTVIHPLITDPQRRGFRIGGQETGALGFEDDIVLLAASIEGAQADVDQVRCYMNKLGMTLNPRKSCSLLITSMRNSCVEKDPSLSIWESIQNPCKNVYKGFGFPARSQIENMSYPSRQMYQSKRSSRDVRVVVNADYKTQYNGAIQSFVPQQGRRNWQVTPARRQHNTRRTEQMSDKR
jgi:hypothetical protein